MTQGAGRKEQEAGSRKQGAGSREQEAGSREQGAGSKDAFLWGLCVSVVPNRSVGRF
jgi:hypothetical protein